VSDKKRNSNGLGHTFNVGNSYKTVIRRKGRVFTATAKTQQDSRKLAKIKADNFLPSIEKPIVEKDVLLSEFLLSWLDNEHRHNVAYTTYKRYRSLAVQHINPRIGDYLLNDLTARVITFCLSGMRDAGQSIRSQQQARALLSICLGEAESLDYLQVNPVRKVKNPQGASKTFEPLKIEEVKRLLKTFEGTYLSARLHIALICGMRQGESLGLRWKDVDLDKRTIEVQAQIQYVDRKPMFTNLKTARSRRTVVLTQETIDALRGHVKIVEKLRWNAGSNWEDWDLVFPSALGTPRSPKTDYDQWQDALKLCGITPRRLHDARHTAATLMYASGVGIETISRALGHSSSAITSRLYVHSAEAPLRDAASRLEKILK
jgi:integrase